jgi:hypothetical protein
MDAWLTRRSVLGGTLGGGLIAAIGTTSAKAETGGTEPSEFAAAVKRMVHSRKDWRARRPKRRIDVLALGPDHIVIHHTASANTKDYSVAHAYALSRKIQKFHMDGRNWNDIGEQITISRGGHIMEGRAHSLPAILSGRHVVGAQTLHHNTHTIGIENEGTYTRAKVPARLWRSLVRTCTVLCVAYGLDPHQAIVGHRDFNRTECPGDMLYARLPALRRAVAARLETSQPRRHVGG